MKKKILLIIVAVVILGISFGAGYFVGKGPADTKAEQYKKVIDYYFPSVESPNSVSGKIISVNNNSLAIETITQDSYVLPNERQIKTITILISENTKITKFNARTGKDVEIKLSDLKINDQIKATSDVSIKDKTEFEAKIITLSVAP